MRWLLLMLALILAFPGLSEAGSRNQFRQRQIAKSNFAAGFHAGQNAAFRQQQQQRHIQQQQFNKGFRAGFSAANVNNHCLRH